MSGLRVWVTVRVKFSSAIPNGGPKLTKFLHFDSGEDCEYCIQQIYLMYYIYLYCIVGIQVLEIMYCLRNCIIF